MSIRADGNGSPTEQVRARAGWRLVTRGERIGGGPTRCDRCASVDWGYSRTGVWCAQHRFATRATGTCASAATRLDTARDALLRACAEIELTPPGLRTDGEHDSLAAMLEELGRLDQAPAQDAQAQGV